MPVADYKIYCKMLHRARKGHYAYPAINVTSLTTANAVLKGLAESKSDGIVQVSTGGGAFASGSSVKDMALGAISIAEHVHRAAERYPIYVALHTDHCQADKLDKLVLPLVEETERRRAAGRPNLFNSHMFDRSALPLKENLDIAAKLLERFQKNELVLEIEAGVVGGEEDGVKGEAGAKLYTTLEDILEQVNFCLIPEASFTLDGLLGALKQRLERRGYAVIVVAEGAGQELFEASGERDASGNIKYGDIGTYLRDAIRDYFRRIGMEINLKYIDPSYMIRSQPANPHDSALCLIMGYNAVHAGMAGRTGMIVGFWNHQFTHVPIPLAVSTRKKIDPSGWIWSSVLASTGQPAVMK